MSNLTVFEYNAKEVRTILIDGEPWFVAKDLCEVLDICNVRQNLAKLDNDEKGVYSVDTLGGKQDMAVVSESGMYTLILRSRKPEAQPFRKWVTSEVLPTIRKTGSYALAETEQPQLPQTYLEALKALVAAEEEKEALLKEKALIEAERDMLEGENEHLAEMVDELHTHSSIIRVAKFNNVSEKVFRWQYLKAMSLKMGLEIKKVECPRFGTKNLYHHDVWRYVYPEYKLPETVTLVIKP